MQTVNSNGIDLLKTCRAAH